jgi:hypothetical protein
MHMCCTLHAVTQINSVQLNVRQEPLAAGMRCHAHHQTVTIKFDRRRHIW